MICFSRIKAKSKKNSAEEAYRNIFSCKFGQVRFKKAMPSKNNFRKDYIMQPIKIMPCLDMKNGRVVKGVHFVDIKEAGTRWKTPPFTRPKERMSWQCWI